MTYIFQYSIGDAAKLDRNRGSGNEYLLSILHWRCEVAKAFGWNLPLFTFQYSIGDA